MTAQTENPSLDDLASVHITRSQLFGAALVHEEPVKTAAVIKPPANGNGRWDGGDLSGLFSAPRAEKPPKPDISRTFRPERPSGP